MFYIEKEHFPQTYISTDQTKQTKTIIAHTISAMFEFCNNFTAEELH